MLLLLLGVVPVLASKKLTVVGDKVFVFPSRFVDLVAKVLETACTLGRWWLLVNFHRRMKGRGGVPHQCAAENPVGRGFSIQTRDLEMGGRWGGGDRGSYDRKGRKGGYSYSC